MSKKFMQVVGMMAVCGMLLSPSVARCQEAVVAKGKQVKLDYTLTVDNEMVETTKGKEPLTYDAGQGMLIVGLEKQLEGMKAGEEKKVVVSPEEGYGVVDPKLVREFEKSKFPADMAPVKGMVVEMQDPQGQPYPATISEVKDTMVMLDFNHPLAGKTLTFDVKIVSIEDVKEPVAEVVPATEPVVEAAPVTEVK
jgi:FKBP-type peptidyl-prolyl cis-trans isomerase 2